MLFATMFVIVGLKQPEHEKPGLIVRLFCIVIVPPR